MGERVRDPPPSGSGCGQFAQKLKIWGFKEGSFIPGKIFLDDGQVKKKITASRMKIVCSLPGKIN